jgi:hypothetical protein
MVPGLAKSESIDSFKTSITFGEMAVVAALSRYIIFKMQAEVECQP